MVFTSLIKSGVEHMMGKNNMQEKFMQYPYYTVEPTLNHLAVILIWLIIILIIGKYLWNEHAVKCISIISPLKSIWQLLAVIILVDLVRPSCC